MKITQFFIKLLMQHIKTLIIKILELSKINKNIWLKFHHVPYTGPFSHISKAMCSCFRKHSQCGFPIATLCPSAHPGLQICTYPLLIYIADWPCSQLNLTLVFECRCQRRLKGLFPTILTITINFEHNCYFVWLIWW